MERIGFHYEAVREYNPRVVYGEVTGYGKAGPWRDKPGQDLLAQSLTGLPWLNGDASQPPVPFGLAIADMFAGAHLVQGILACLVRRGITGQGGKVEVSLMESVLDFQFEVITTHLNDGGLPPARSAVNNAHAYLGAPYGIYATADGYLALAMGSVSRLGELLGCGELLQYTDVKRYFTERDRIKEILARHLAGQTTRHWLSILEPADVWCSGVLTWQELMEHEAFQTLDFVQVVTRRDGVSLPTTRCPIRIDGEIYKSPKGAPSLGQHTTQILAEISGGRKDDPQ
jgi:crotonobetainyl-CoA:carnitine CoA-transferase CaiB-like acyl-CoA transferase